MCASNKVTFLSVHVALVCCHFSSLSSTFGFKIVLYTFVEFAILLSKGERQLCSNANDELQVYFTLFYFLAQKLCYYYTSGLPKQNSDRMCLHRPCKVKQITIHDQLILRFQFSDSAPLDGYIENERNVEYFPVEKEW